MVISEVHGVIEVEGDGKQLQVAAAAMDVDRGQFFVASESSMLVCYSLASSKVSTASVLKVNSFDKMRQRTR